MYGFGCQPTRRCIACPSRRPPIQALQGQLQSRSNTGPQRDKRRRRHCRHPRLPASPVSMTQATVASLSFQKMRFCVKRQGLCLPSWNCSWLGQNLAPDRSRCRSPLRFNASEGGVDYGVAGFKLQDLCGSSRRPPPPSSGCPDRCGTSNGDPHLRTINRYKYDFQGCRRVRAAAQCRRLDRDPGPSGALYGRNSGDSAESASIRR